jgi:DNA-directed RNA polymerase subunit M/transcription elongation factor TFIIS
MSKKNSKEEYETEDEMENEENIEEDEIEDVEEEGDERDEEGDEQVEEGEELEDEDFNEEIDDQDNQPEEQDIELDIDTGGDDSFIFEDNKRKKATRRKLTKKKLFPFVQKKKKVSEPLERQEHNYLSMKIRESTVEFLTNYCNSIGKSLNNNEPITFEKSIYEASLDKGILNKNVYVHNVKYFIGAFEELKKQNIITEIRSKNTLWTSSLFQKAITHEQNEINKLLNPLEASDNPDYPCPRCKSTKSYKSIKNLRSGDEGASALFLCGSRDCGFRWRING